ncbi:MAG: hypothetical protein GC184_13410 [Rhizobiales bacterium]|nr:hypothetical protein [Hyphomicrobiales bacterium]
MRTATETKIDHAAADGFDTSAGLGASDPRRATRWVLKYSDRIYGPYSFEAMTSYIAEGRVAAHSLIAPEGTPAGALMWQYAENTPAFFEYFGRAPAPVEQPAAEPVAEETAPEAAAEPAVDSDQVAQLKNIISSVTAEPHAGEAEADEIAFEPTTEAVAPVGPGSTDQGAERRTYGTAKGQIDRRAQPESSNFVVITDVKSRYAGQLEQAIMSAGPAYKLAANVWCLNADATAAALLNDLSRHIGKSDSLVVVDATRDRAVWTTLGPETEAKMRRVWRRNF